MGKVGSVLVLVRPDERVKTETKTRGMLGAAVSVSCWSSPPWRGRRVDRVGSYGGMRK